MGGKRKLSPDEFAERLLKIVRPKLAQLDPEERNARIEAFEKTVRRAASDSHATASGTHQTHCHPLAARGHE